MFSPSPLIASNQSWEGFFPSCFTNSWTSFKLLGPSPVLHKAKSRPRSCQVLLASPQVRHWLVITHLHKSYIHLGQLSAVSSAQADESSLTVWDVTPSSPVACRRIRATTSL
jgi:hypothetical protein